MGTPLGSAFYRHRRRKRQDYPYRFRYSGAEVSRQTGTYVHRQYKNYVNRGEYRNKMTSMTLLLLILLLPCELFAAVAYVQDGEVIGSGSVASINTTATGVTSGNTLVAGCMISSSNNCPG